MAELDLDKFRAAREEAEGTGPKYVLLRGEKFEIPSEPPLAFAWALQEDKAKDALRLLLGDEPFERFMALDPSTGDLGAIMENLGELYPGSSGEGSKVSRSSSRRTTPKPRPTSNASTD